MPTVHVPTSRFNSSDIADELQVRTGDMLLRREGNAPALLETGHPDEAVIDPSDDDARNTQAEIEAGRQEYYTDQAVQIADVPHTATLSGALEQAKAAFGNADMCFQRTLSVGDQRTAPIGYGLMIMTPSLICGIGTTPAAAFENAGKAIDARFGITSTPAGYTVPGVAAIAARPTRSKAEAEQFARRIAMDATYLDVLLTFDVDGVKDLRPGPNGGAAAA